MMANGKKKNKGHFEPGKSGNPNGRPRTPEDIRNARKLTKLEFEAVANKLLFLNREKIKEIVRNSETTMIEHLIASIFVRGVQDGSPAHLNFILDRLIGKITEKIEHSTPKPFIMHLRDGSQMVMGHRLEKDEEE